jgi:tRNA threonylcarbamoyladenosine biosynthesis protein TsaB
VVKILAIETATDVCSVALGMDGEVLVSKTARDRNVHSTHLGHFIREVLEEAGEKIKDMDAVAVSKGPGSFTGLRIGVSMAKGITWGLDLPLISVGTLQALAYSFTGTTDDHTFLCPVVDARNNEFYFAVYDHLMQEVLPVQAGLIEMKAFEQLDQGRHIVFFGDGIEKIKDELKIIPNAVVMENILPDAVNLIAPAVQKYNNRDFENLSTFEPYYLRDFKARNLGKKIARILYPENDL